MTRDRYPSQSLGTLHGRIKQSRVLLVGAGGIGCELLKNLVLTGFGEIHLVDLDTIDLSNLNRQFLFRHEHIKKSKALVAKETALKFNPHVKIEAHHANIKDPQFNLNWFKGFHVVFNALDNLDARRYVNKMCLLADVPLIESGTTGFNGQVQVIKKGKTECYDCNHKEVPKTFPVCTIRSTPSQPIHCIVWAKSYLFTELFGVSESEEAGMDLSEDSENAEELKNLREEAQALKSIKEAIGCGDFVRQVFEKVYKKDIERLQSMEDMWKARKRPTALAFDDIFKDASAIEASISKHDQTIWTLQENFAVFSDSLRRLSIRLKQAQASSQNGASPVLTFDKDDEDTLDFVAAAANLRSAVFDIGMKSKFDIKQMAGNIIPAIATTNAMTAGLCVLQAFKVMRDQVMKAKTVFLERSSTSRVLSSDVPSPPNPSCGVCAVAHSDLSVDPARATLGNLVEDVLKQKLGYSDDLSVSNDAGLLYDPDFDDNFSKKFSDLGIKSDTFLTIMDEEDHNPRVNLSLAITEQTFPEGSKPISVPDNLSIARKPRSQAHSTVNGETNGATNGAMPTLSNGDSGKRKRSPVDDKDYSTKRVNMSGKPLLKQDDVLLVDDSAEGTILIDD